jgi:uncharacterized membrane protein
MSDANLRRLKRIGWAIILFITAIGTAGALNHLLDQLFATGDSPAVRDANVSLFGASFFRHWLAFRTYPVARVAHMLPGLLFMLLAPLQFVPSLRRRQPRFHRVNGRAVLALSLALIPSGMIFAFVHPYVGFPEQVPAVFYTVLYLCCAAMGLRSIRRRDFLRHREWMIRVYAFGLGIYSIRVWYWLFLHLTQQPSTEFFATSFWIGIASNLVVAETWIGLTRGQSAQPSSVRPVAPLQLAAVANSEAPRGAEARA